MRSHVEVDAITAEVSRVFDFDFSGETTFTPPEFSVPVEPFGIGLIVGPSGSGKSTLLGRAGKKENVYWDAHRAVASHFSSAEDAAERLSAVGLNSLPAWLRPYPVLSTGEKFRADLARSLTHGAVIDEYTSVVDRNVAKSCSVALRRYVDRRGLSRIVLASCHYDIIDWLQPDWCFDTATGKFLERGDLRPRPSIELRIVPCTAAAWPSFKQHHYLSADINKSSRCWLALWGEAVVGFAAAIAFPNGNFKNAWRGHRTVVLPDFQGIGIGVRLSDAIGQMFVEDGCRYFSKTAHPRMGAYRDASAHWRATSKNGRARKDYSLSRGTKEDGHKMKHAGRVCWSHEYIGAQR